MTDVDASVGIVGAGPVGLACGLRLASFGVDSVILEAQPRLERQGSKACLIQGDVVDILDKVGCGERIALEGIRWNVARTYVRGKEVATQVYPLPPGFGPFINISQHRIQELLLERVATNLLCEVRWSHRVTSVDAEGDRPTVEITTPTGPRTLRFAYLVACDGLRSTVRESLRVRYTGDTYADTFLISDIRARLPFAHERHFHFDPPFNPGRQLVMHAQPDDIWRIDWQLAPDADVEEERRTGVLDRRIRSVIGDVPYEIDWISTYHFCQRLVERMRVRRVFLAGDAAHALPPYGARGMNSGIQDADNLAWKLGYVLAGSSDESLLESYHAERHAAALENLHVTEQTIRFMVPRSRGRKVARDALLRVVSRLGFLKGRVNSGRMAEPFRYLDSPIVERSTNPLVGALAPDLAVSVSGRQRTETRLRKFFGDGFVALDVARDRMSAQRFARAFVTVSTAVPVRPVIVLADADAATVDLQADIVYRPAQECVYTELGGDMTWYLVRPDGHVACAHPIEDVCELDRMLAFCGHIRDEPRHRQPTGGLARPELLDAPSIGSRTPRRA